MKNFETVCIKRSNIGQFKDGLGVYTSKKFNKGDILIKWNLKILSAVEYESLPLYE